MSIYRGFALIYTDGKPIYGIDKTFRSAFAGSSSAFRRRCSSRRDRALAFLLVRFTTLGEQIIAVGGNEEAARLSGVDVDRVKVSVYAISGVLSSRRRPHPGRAHRRGGADRRQRLRAASDRRRGHRRGEPVRRRRQSAGLARRRA